MRAMVYSEYGTPDVLKMQDIEKPVPGEGEVLVKIHAASVNSWDRDLVYGTPYPYRLFFGIFKPRFPVIGSDIAGTVESVGKNTTLFQAGDTVFGDTSGSGFGAFAEYVAVPEKLLMPKPNGLTFEEAAAVPQGALLAMQGLRHWGEIKPEYKVLINGAGGGGGTYAMQLAKSYGVELTAVDNEYKQDLLLQLGADYVIDFQRNDFTKSGKQYDRILDFEANHSINSYIRALKTEGIYVVVGGSISLLLKILYFGSLFSLRSKKKLEIVLQHVNPIDMKLLADYCESGLIKPVIDQVFPLEELPAAISRLKNKRSLGKLVIRI